MHPTPPEQDRLASSAAAEFAQRHRAADERQAIQARIRRLGWMALARIVRLTYRLAAAGAVGTVAGAAAQLALGDWGLAFAVNVGVTAVALAVAALPLRDPDLRAALEVYSDHLQLERVEWKLFTGTRLPSGFAQMERWLREHPDAPHGRPSLLIGLGRFEEAEADLARHPPMTRAERYERELVLQQGRLFAGQSPDLTVLHRDLPMLADEARRHRRQCVAMLEAQMAVDGGGDPTALLASGRDARGPVYARSRWFVNPVTWLAIAQFPSWIALVIWALG